MSEIINMTVSTPSPVSMSVEPVSVVNAVSPRVSFSRGDGCTIVTIEDVTGVHTAEIPDGAQGPQGIQGPQGDTGATGNGIASITLNADYTLTITYTNGQAYTTTSIRGAQGEQGEQGIQGIQGPAGTDGQDGFSPTASVTQTATGATISITDKQGTTTANIENGADGTDGTDGQDGFSPTITVTDITGGHRVTITDADGAHSFDVMDGTGSVQDVQVNGVSVLNAQGVANVPIGSGDTFGVFKTLSDRGTSVSNGKLEIVSASDNQIKNGNSGYRSAATNKQHAATFYGLAKAAGADMKDIASTTVGIYPEAQKSAISTMLSAPVTVTGTTPTITALSGIQYVCGEVSTLDITLPASGIVDVVFTSGSTPTVLTITPPTGMTVEWANDFDSTSLEADTLYELNIKMVGSKCLGVAGAWS